MSSPRTMMAAGLALSAALAGGFLWDGTRGVAGASSTRTVTYCVEGGQPLAMTVFAPDTSGHPDPAVL